MDTEHLQGLPESHEMPGKHCVCAFSFLKRPGTLIRFLKHLVTPATTLWRTITLGIERHLGRFANEWHDLICILERLLVTI